MSVKVRIQFNYSLAFGSSSVEGGSCKKQCTVACAFVGQNNALFARLATWIYTALSPADLDAVYPGALLAHRALFGPECTRSMHYLSTVPHTFLSVSVL